MDAHGIEYQIQEETSGFDPSLVMSNAPMDYAVKIKSTDFEQVNQLLKESESVNVEDVEKDYYLFGFTDEELMDILIKADEWSPFDVGLARKILADRGKTISDKDIADINEKRIEELKVVKPLSTWLLFVSYVLAFGLVGFPIGWYLATAKRTLPDGERIYSFTQRDRKHGLRILWIAAITFILGLLYRFEWMSS
ncbi:MAG TPA: hypothetical protein VHE59_00635 [Mucilaginibacter sp.]|nr:hypothetical protein [Mucilaginibacter sp.]